MAIDTNFQTTETIGNIVSRFPKAADIFKQYRIDFCCGGERPLADAIAKQQLNGEEIIRLLNEAYEEQSERLSGGDKDWRIESFTNLIDHVITKHHQFLVRELPELSQYVTKILRVHGMIHGESLSPLYRMYHEMKMELEQHLIKEEEHIFPLIKSYEENPSKEAWSEAVRVIEELEDEHEQVGNLLKEMRKVTNDYELPEGACRTYQLTFQKLMELEADLFEHIHLENNILFPRFNAIEA